MSRRNSLGRAFTEQRGSLLIGALLLVLVMTVIGVGLFQAGIMESNQIAKTETDVRAFYAADAGIHRVALDVADPDAAHPVGALTFDGLKAALPGDATTLFALTGYGSTCFGATTCDSTQKPFKPAYLVQARNDLTVLPAGESQFWLISTSCTPGPATNPCPAGAKMAQVQALMKKTFVTIPIWKWAAFGGNGLGIGGSGGFANSYNSHLTGCTVPCPAGGSNILNHGNIGSNASIDLTSTIAIGGNIVNTTNVVADPSDVSLGSSVTVTGNIISGGTVVVNSVTNPDGQSGGNGTGTTSQVSGTITHDTASAQVNLAPLPNCGPPYTDLTGKVTQYPQNADHTCNWTGTPIAATWKYGGTTGCGNCGVTGSKAGELVAGGGACIALAPTLTGPGYCLGNVTFSGGTWLEVTDRTIMTVDGVFTLSGGGFANTTQLAQNFQLISTYGNDPSTETKTGVTLSGGSDMYATIYAPTTMAVVSGGGDLYGGVMANKVSFTGGSGVYYDEYLGTGNGNLVTDIKVNTLTMASWKRVACGASTFPC